MATKRGYYREELMRATKNLEMALTHLHRVREAYKEAHPEVSLQVSAVGDGLVIAAELLEKIHESI